MGSGIYKTVKGERIELTHKEVKAFVMKVNNWTASEYQKKYDIFKNKLRAFEAYEKFKGADVQKQSPAQLLYKEARAKKSLGGEYKPSIKMQRIREFTSVSMGKAGQKALQGKVYQERRAATYEKATSKQFQGLIEKNEMARKIADSIQDPVKCEQALADYANSLHAKIDEEGRINEEEAIPFGEMTGSDDPIEFNISDYL